MKLRVAAHKEAQKSKNSVSNTIDVLESNKPLNPMYNSVVAHSKKSLYNYNYKETVGDILKDPLLIKIFGGRCHDTCEPNKV